MNKLSEPVAKALEKLSLHCKGDNIMIMRIIVGNYSPEQYSLQLFDEIYLIRQAPFNNILIALVESLKDGKATEQPSAAAAVEGILTEEELNKLEFINNDSSQQITLNKKSIRELITSHRHLLSANAELSFKNQKLKEICKKSFHFVDAMENFLGDNLQVMGWHQNGDPEPLDNFINENIDSNLWQDLKALTSEVKL